MTLNLLLTYLLVALGLSMDAFCVSISAGICIRDMKFRYMIRMALTFGFMQFVMPLVGYALGETMKDFIRGFDHWIAFGLLAFIGLKMIRESRSIKDSASCDDGEAEKNDVMDPRTLVKLSVATSIDALAVGVSFAVLGQPIILPSVMIGIVTLGVCLFGAAFGKRLGTVFEKGAEIAGGIVLLGIGAKILVEHLLTGV